MTQLRFALSPTCFKSIPLVAVVLMLNASCSTLAPTGNSIALLHSIHHADLKGKAMIVGRLSDSKSGKPLPNANVMVWGTDRGSLTDSDGNYAMSDIMPGEYVVKAALMGYAPCTSAQLTVNANAIVVLDFKLVPQKSVTIEAVD